MITINEKNPWSAPFFGKLMQLVKENGCLHNHENSILVINKFKEFGLPVDKDVTIKWFEKNGGYCDCEVLFNVWTKYDSIIRNHPNPFIHNHTDIVR